MKQYFYFILLMTIGSNTESMENEKHIDNGIYRLHRDLTQEFGCLDRFRNFFTEEKIDNYKRKVHEYSDVNNEIIEKEDLSFSDIINQFDKQTTYTIWYKIKTKENFAKDFIKISFERIKTRINLSSTHIKCLEIYWSPSTNKVKDILFIALYNLMKGYETSDVLKSFLNPRAEDTKHFAVLMELLIPTDKKYTDTTIDFIIFFIDQVSTTGNTLMIMHTISKEQLNGIENKIEEIFVKDVIQTAAAYACNVKNPDGLHKIVDDILLELQSSSNLNNNNIIGNKIMKKEYSQPNITFNENLKENLLEK